MTTLFSGHASSPTAPYLKEDDVGPLRRWFAVRRGEPAVAAALEGAGHWLSMARDDTCRVTDVCDFPIHCREGTLWVTSPEYPGDTVVGTGEHLSVTTRGTIVVAALAPSSMWVPEGFAVDNAQGSSTRRMQLIKLRQAGAPPCPAASASDETRPPTTDMVRRTPFQKFVMLLNRFVAPLIDAAAAAGRSARGALRRAVAALSRRNAPGMAASREHYLSQSVDRADFEHRNRAWDVHEARLRRLPPVR